MKNEPVAIGVMVISALKSFLLLGASMGWFDLTPQQQDAWLGFASALNLLVDGALMIFIRHQVTPVRKFRKRVQDAINKGHHEEVRAPAVPLAARHTPPPPDVPGAVPADHPYGRP